MEFFSSDGVEIAYAVEGEGNPILLIHGFASNMQTNWGRPGWIKLLTRNGFQVIAFDNRGHGASEKLYDPEAYTGPIMAEDARRLLDHLGIERADVLGYSMGARIAAFLGLQHPERVRSAVFAGLGANMVYGLGDPKPIAAALLSRRPVNDRRSECAGFSHFRRSDEKRPQGACRLHHGVPRPHSRP